jgi:nitrate/nitrite-specific signal transduction histidine kinase
MFKEDLGGFNVSALLAILAEGGKITVNIEKAINLFFPKPSLELVSFEAVANAIDANATDIWIDINITDFNDVSAFKLQISDNGDGFTEKNFRKFSNLLEVGEKTQV